CRSHKRREMKHGDRAIPRSPAEARSPDTGREDGPARFFVPSTDIYKTEDGLTVVMEMPGVEKENVTVKLENGVLSVEGHINSSKYQDMQPVYTEYNVGHFARSFTLSESVDQGEISAELNAGVLT